MHYKKIKKNKIDICNICEQSKKLTWEHVPPKSCGNDGNVAVRNIFNIQDFKEKLDSQNGVRYRSICQECNNNLLGSQADVEIKKLYNHVKYFIETTTDINKTSSLHINLILILRCLFGKLLAMDNEISGDVVSIAMKEFILHNKISSSLHVYFRIYPYRTTIQMRSCLVKNILGKDSYCTNGLISLLYFYPLAFIVSSNEEKDINLTDLMKYINFNNPYVHLKYDPSSAYNPITKKILPYDWLASIANDKHDLILLCKTSVARIGAKK